MTRPLVVLVGPPGAGKTSVGALLAQQLGAAFRDTDQDIEVAAGKPIAEIFYDEGEDHFRALETSAIAVALAGYDGVLALGGGAVIDAVTRGALGEHTVVFLDVALGDAAARVGLARNRPVLALNPRAHLKHLLDERRPLYVEVATHTVDTTGRTVDDIARDIANWLPS